MYIILRDFLCNSSVYFEYKYGTFFTVYKQHYLVGTSTYLAVNSENCLEHLRQVLPPSSVLLPSILHLPSLTRTLLDKRN